ALRRGVHHRRGPPASQGRTQTLASPGRFTLPQAAFRGPPQESPSGLARDSGHPQEAPVARVERTFRACPERSRRVRVQAIYFLSSRAGFSRRGICFGLFRKRFPPRSLPLHSAGSSFSCSTAAPRALGAFLNVASNNRGYCTCPPLNNCSTVRIWIRGYVPVPNADSSL